MKIIILNLILIFSNLTLFAQSDNDWTQYRGNRSLQGFYDGNLAEKPGLLWTYDSGDQIAASAVVKDDKIIFGNMSGEVFCLDTSGNLSWKHQSSNGIEGSALIYGDNAFIGNLSGDFMSFNLKSSKLNWTYKAENQISAAPSFYFSEGKLKLLIGSYDFYLHSVDAENGKNDWKYELDNYLNGTVAIEKDKILFGGCDGFLHILSTKGNLIKKFELASYIAGSPSVDNSFAVIGDYDGGVNVVNTDLQRVLWSFKIPDNDVGIVSSPAIYKDKVVFTSRDKNVYCLDKKTGKLLWKYNTGFKIDASPIIAKDGVLVANMRGNIYFLNLETGEEIWKFQLGSPIRSNPAFFNGRILITSMDGNIYCLRN